MVLEYVTGGELFDRLASKGKLSEEHGRRLFQQLIDGVSYCHKKGVFHRDVKLENILLDAKGNIKVIDFGLSALPENFKEDGLFHTTCGSPNYVAPKILAYRGYDGVASDVWSCGIILFVILAGYLTFDDRNLAVLYQKISQGFVQVPKYLSPSAQHLIKRILDLNPIRRITMAEIKADEWFTKGYNPCNLDDEDTIHIDEGAFSKNEQSEGEMCLGSPALNAFQLISMSSFFDLSGFFEKEDVYERMIRFTSNLSHKDLLVRIEETVLRMGFRVQRKNGKLKEILEQHGEKVPRTLSVAEEVSNHSLFVTSTL